MSPNPLDRLHHLRISSVLKEWRNLRIKAILIGTLVEIGGSILVGVIAIALGVDLHTPSLPVLAASTGIGFGLTFLGGFVAARLARTAELMNSGIVGAIVVALGVSFLSFSPNPMWLDVTALLLTIPVAMLGGHLARGKGEKVAIVSGPGGKMKRFLQTVALLFGILLLGIVAFIAYDMHSARPHTVQLVTAEELTVAEVDYLKQGGFLELNEKLIYFSSEGGIESAGVLLTDRRVISYQGNIVEAGNIEDIEDISVHDADSMWEVTTIMITMKDNTQVMCRIFKTNGGDKRFLTTLRNLSIKSGP